MRPALEVVAGPWLLRSPAPDLLTHRNTHGSLPGLGLEALLGLVEGADVRGRGGAGFPFATKLRTAASRRGRRHVVVNFSEGEPASHKDLALALTQPHLVLDGAAATARALGVRTVHLVLPGEHADAGTSVRTALAERSSEDRQSRVRWTLHVAGGRFVSGESSAVTELIHGRPGLPVTTWTPSAVAGVRGRPTLLSNAETFAHVAALVLDRTGEYAALGAAGEPGTRLLTLAGRDPARVVEVPHGTAWADVLDDAELGSPILLGGYHGTWAAAGALRGRTVSAEQLGEVGLALGAGVVLPLPPRVCPLDRTARVVHYLAGQSAGRCGPCLNGLPALADAFQQLVDGRRGPAVTDLVRFVEGRGACAHPDGTARLLRSTLDTFAGEVARHAHGLCTVARRSGAAS